jgi:hypothetical protein
VRRSSKVHFSPKTVERRIAYNDQDTERHDTGMDADVSSVSTLSPMKSKLKKKVTSELKKGTLRLDTSDRVNQSREREVGNAPGKKNGNAGRKRRISDNV